MMFRAATPQYTVDGIKRREDVFAALAARLPTWCPVVTCNSRPPLQEGLRRPPRKAAHVVSFPYGPAIGAPDVGASTSMTKLKDFY